MWFIFSIVTFFAWGTADLFYKSGNKENEKYSHLKTGAMVGIVMGAVAIATIIITNLDYNPINILIYLPVSVMYILSMVVGYFGLKYLELSISSPIQNASGAVSALLMMIVLRRFPGIWTLIAMVVITVGVVLLGYFEKNTEVSGEKKYKIGFVAFFIPILYCIIDSFGTFFDGIYLDNIETTPLIGVTEDNIENVANVSYQLTFLFSACVILIFLLVFKKEKIVIKEQGSKFIAACLEAGGQITYVFALSGNGIVAAPIIASYCVCSAVLARVFLKEKLSIKQYIAVSLVVIGIIILGILEA